MKHSKGSGILKRDTFLMTMKAFDGVLNKTNIFEQKASQEGGDEKSPIPPPSVTLAATSRAKQYTGSSVSTASTFRNLDGHVKFEAVKVLRNPARTNSARRQSMEDLLWCFLQTALFYREPFCPSDRMTVPSSLLFQNGDYLYGWDSWYFELLCCA